MNVLHITEHASIGGNETNLLNLLTHLDRGEFRSHVVAFSEGELTRKLEELNISYTVLSSVGFFAYPIWRELRQIIQEEQIDLIHSHGSRATFHSLICTKSLRIPVIRTIHRWPFYYRKNHLTRGLYHLLEKYIIGKADQNIAVSDSIAEFCKYRFGANDIKVIPNGVDTEVFHPSAGTSTSKLSLGIPDTRTVVGFISRLSQQKDPLTLIRAFAEAQKQDRNLHLLMVGQGLLHEQCLLEINRLGIEKFTTCMEYHARPSELLKVIDIFCLPTRYEAMPIALLEAMAVKCAVITTPVSGNTEIVAHEVNGLLAPVGNVAMWAENILRLHNNKELRQVLGHRARMVVEYHHNVKDSACETENLYRKLYLSNEDNRQQLSYGMLKQA